MDTAVEGMSEERNKIFNAFALGLIFNLLTVMATCLIIMVRCFKMDFKKFFSKILR
jgi:hypothetical protein